MHLQPLQFSAILSPFTLNLLLLLLLPLPLLVSAQRNVTVDDTDATIVYQPAGAWFLSANSSLDFGVAHMLTQNPNATATFNFTGIAIYFLSPLWPYLVNTALSLDGAPPTLVDLRDQTRADTGGVGSESVGFSVVWSAAGLNDTAHTLVVSVGAGQPFAIVDGLIYTVTDAGNNATPPPGPGSPPPSPTGSSTTLAGAPTSSTTSPAPTPTSPSPAPSTQTTRTRIAVGAALGTLGLLLLSLIAFFCIRKRRRRRPLSEAWTIARRTPSPSSKGGVGAINKGSGVVAAKGSGVGSRGGGGGGGGGAGTTEASSSSSPSTANTGPSPISLGPPATYPMPPTIALGFESEAEGRHHPYSSVYAAPLGEEEAWLNPRYGYVGMPVPGPLFSSAPSAPGKQQPAFGAEDEEVDMDRVVDMDVDVDVEDRNDPFSSHPPPSFHLAMRYTPGVALSTITENSPTVTEGGSVAAGSSLSLAQDAREARSAAPANTTHVGADTANTVTTTAAQTRANNLASSVPSPSSLGSPSTETSSGSSSSSSNFFLASNALAARGWVGGAGRPEDTSGTSAVPYVPSEVVVAAAQAAVDSRRRDLERSRPAIRRTGSLLARTVYPSRF